jgi:hypothetical protein
MNNPITLHRMPYTFRLLSRTIFGSTINRESSVVNALSNAPLVRVFTNRFRVTINRDLSITFTTPAPQPRS